MSNRSEFCFLLAGICFVSWKHSLIGVEDALKLAGRAFFFLGICTWLIYVFPRLKSFFFPVYQELPDSPLHESSSRKQEQLHNDKGEEDQTCHDADVDENPTQGARRRRQLLQTVTHNPVQQEVPKQKKVIVLPDEPSADTEGVVKIALRCPSGRTIYRRFLKTWTSLLLHDWMVKTGYHPAFYTLCTSYPRKVLVMAADMSLEQAGILTNTVLIVKENEQSITKEHLCFEKAFMD